MQLRIITDLTITFIMCSGPKEKLDSTAVSQPAIYVASLAAVEKLRATEGEVSHQMHTPQSSTARMCAKRIVVTSSAASLSAQEVLQKADVAAGLSLGEYTALAFADAFRSVGTAKLMQKAHFCRWKVSDCSTAGNCMDAEAGAAVIVQL
jgi:[acyl-carrier-protein] S-malonyltransferase